LWYTATKNLEERAGRRKALLQQRRDEAAPQR
jgi:hypothetical protein